MYKAGNNKTEKVEPIKTTAVCLVSLLAAHMNFTVKLNFTEVYKPTSIFTS